MKSNFTELRIKDGTKKINCNYLSNRVKEHGKCSIGGCYNNAEYMKHTKSVKSYYYLIIGQEEVRAWMPFDLSKIIYQKKD